MSFAGSLDFGAWWRMVKSSASAWVDDYAPSMGAALAYYTVFSVAPLLLIVISVAGLVFGEDAARGAIFGQLRGLMGDEGAKAVEGLLQSVNTPEKSIVATVVGIGMLLVGATTVFAELQDALDRIWRAPARDRQQRRLGAAARPRAVVRHDHGHRLPADGLAGAERRARRRSASGGGRCSAAGRRWPACSTSSSASASSRWCSR